MSTQRLVPEGKNYRWESLPFMTYKRAKRIVSLMSGVKEAMFDALDGLELRKKKLNGARLKEVLLAVAAQEGWYFTPSHAPRRTKHRTLDPSTRRCLKCLQVKAEGEFIREATDKQKTRWRAGGNLVTHTTRAYTRPLQPMQVAYSTCNECANARASARRPQGYVRLLDAMHIASHAISGATFRLRRLKPLSTRTPYDTVDEEGKRCRIAFYGQKRALLDVCRARLRAMRKAKQTRYPMDWWDLATPAEIARLKHAFDNVGWYRKEGKML